MQNIKDYKTFDENNAMSRTKKAAGDIRSSAEDVIGEAKDDLRDVANRTGRTIRGFLSTASDDVTQAKETITSAIRTRPVQSSLIALGAGFVLASLLRR